MWLLYGIISLIFERWMMQINKQIFHLKYWTRSQWLEICLFSNCMSIDISYCFPSLANWFSLVFSSMLFCQHLTYDKTICASLLYQYIWWFTLYLPCFLYLVQASTVNFKAYCVHTTSTLSSISLCLWVCLLLCMQGAFNQSAKLSNFFSSTHSPIFAQYCEIIS